MIDELKTCFINCVPPTIKLNDSVDLEPYHKGIVISILTEEWYDDCDRYIRAPCVLPDKYVDYKRLSRLGYRIECPNYYHFIAWRC